MTVYELFDNTFSIYHSNTYLNLPPRTIDDSSRLGKICYKPDPLQNSISIASGKYVITLNTPS